jgi:hypothetical protein
MSKYGDVLLFEFAVDDIGKDLELAWANRCISTPIAATQLSIRNAYDVGVCQNQFLAQRDPH